MNVSVVVWPLSVFILLNQFPWNWHLRVIGYSECFDGIYFAWCWQVPLPHNGKFTCKSIVATTYNVFLHFSHSAGMIYSKRRYFILKSANILHMERIIEKVATSQISCKAVEGHPNLYSFDALGRLYAVCSNNA